MTRRFRCVFFSGGKCDAIDAFDWCSLTHPKFTSWNYGRVLICGTSTLLCWASKCPEPPHSQTWKHHCSSTILSPWTTFSPSSISTILTMTLSWSAFPSNPNCQRSLLCFSIFWSARDSLRCTHHLFWMSWIWTFSYGTSLWIFH